MKSSVIIFIILIFSLLITFLFSKSKYITNYTYNQENIVPVISFTSLIFSLLLGLTISNLWNKYINIKELINSNIARTKQLYFMTIGYPDTMEIRKNIKKYIENIINVEYPSLKKGKLLFDSKYNKNIILSINNYALRNPNSLLTSSLYELLPERGAIRVLLSEKENYLLILIIIFSVVSLLGFWFIKNQNSNIQFIVDYGIISTIIICIFLIYNLLNPFSGLFEISIEPYKNLLNTFKNIDNETKVPI